MTGSSGFSGHSHAGLDLGGGAPGFAHGMYSTLNFGSGHHAGEVTFDAIVVGHAFTTVSATPHVDAHVDGHALGGPPEGTAEGNGPSFDVPIDAGKTNFGLLVVGLGNCDWESKARAALVKLAMAECFNLQPPSTPPARFDVILPVNFKNPLIKVANPVMPKGFYKGATGSTTVWQSGWEVGERSAFAALTGQPATRKKGCRTNLEVNFTVWHFVEADDYEIRIVVRVIGGKDRGELMDHVNAARDFCKSMLKTLQATPPSSNAKRFRAQLAASQR